MSKTDTPIVRKDYFDMTHGKALEKIDQLERELAAANAENAKLKEQGAGKAICAYCREFECERPLVNPLMLEHMATCEKHPIKKALEENAKLRGEWERLNADNTELRIELQEHKAGEVYAQEQRDHAREDAHQLACRVRDTQDALEAFEQDATDKPVFWPSSVRVKQVIEANRLALMAHKTAAGTEPA